MLYSCQFWDRCKLFLMPAKHQPDHAFLRHVPLRRIHLFTLVQILCLALLWILKSTMAAIIFPVMVRRVWWAPWCLADWAGQCLPAGSVPVSREQGHRNSAEKPIC